MERPMIRPQPAILILALMCATSAVRAAEEKPPLDKLEASVRSVVEVLASDEYEGRGLGTEGLERAAVFGKIEQV